MENDTWKYKSTPVHRAVTVFHICSMGKDKFVKQEKCKGLFHRFGVEYEELRDGVGSYSVAIVELEDGSIITPPVDMIIFNEPLAQVSNAVPK